MSEWGALVAIREAVRAAFLALWVTASAAGLRTP